MNNLTVIDNKITTDNLFRVFGYNEHRRLKEVISSNIDHFLAFGDVRIVTKNEGRGSLGGRPLECYALNFEQCILLSGLAKNKEKSKKVEILRYLINAYSNASIVAVINMISTMDIDECENRFVYVAMEELSGRYKVGISSNPERRIKELNVGNPEKLILVHSYHATESGYKSESIAHAILEKTRIRGEWFGSDTDLSLLPNYSAKCTASSGNANCECIECSNHSLAFDLLADHMEDSRDNFISKLINELGFDFESAVRSVDSLEDTGVIKFKQFYP